MLCSLLTLTSNHLLRVLIIGMKISTLNAGGYLILTVFTLVQ
nr:MAG TPA: hypothetical protein [Caudoviricetes sp.]